MCVTVVLGMGFRGDKVFVVQFPLGLQVPHGLVEVDRLVSHLVAFIVEAVVDAEVITTGLLVKDIEDLLRGTNSNGGRLITVC